MPSFSNASPVDNPVVLRQDDAKKVFKKHPFALLAVLCIFVAGLMNVTNGSFGDGAKVLFAFGTVGIVLWAMWTLFMPEFRFKKRETLWCAVIGAVAAGGLLFAIYCSENLAVFIGVVGLCVIVTTGVSLAATKQLTVSRLAMLLMAAGFVLRVAYVLYTGVSERQHDVFYFGDSRTTLRHAQYIEYFYNNFDLPKVAPRGLSQFYHPPLHHFIAGIWLRFTASIGMNYQTACETIQALTLFYSSSIMIVCYKIFKAFKMKGLALIIPTALICFHPTFIIMAGSVNNDILSVALAFGAVYATILWYKNPKISKIIVVALCVGGSMMSKLSGGLIAPAIALVFLVKLWKKVKEPIGFNLKKGMPILLQFVIFGVICVPLGLWWQVRTSALFGVSLTYVPALSITDSQFVGQYSLLERLFGMNADTFKTIFVSWPDKGGPFYEYNMIIAFFKSAVFGEFSLFYDNGTFDARQLNIISYGRVFSQILFWSFVLIVLVAVVSGIYSIAKKKYAGDWVLTGMLAVIFLVIGGNYINFCIRYAFTCTQNFRYCVPMLLPIAVFLGVAAKSRETKNGISVAGETALKSTLNIALVALVAVFCVSSTAVYLLLGML